MSATLDAELFSSYFGGAQIIYIPVIRSLLLFSKKRIQCRCGTTSAIQFHSSMTYFECLQSWLR